MRKMQNPMLMFLLLGLVATLMGACISVPQAARVSVWTPKPFVSTEAVVAPSTATTAPTRTPLPSPTPTNTPIEPTATATTRATAAATARPTQRPTATARPLPTVDPKRLLVRESDIADAVASGALSGQGAVIDGLDVRFRDGKIYVTATNLQYGMMRVQNLSLVGTPVVQDGKLTLNVESISPRGLVTAMLPTVANQILTQYAAGWYFEEVKSADGQLELRVR